MKKILIIVAVLIILISYFQFGIFTPYNYFTAKYDIITGNPRILVYGKEFIKEEIRNKVAKKNGFNFDRVAGCEVTYQLVNGVEAYNSVVKNYLNVKLGKDWDVRLEKEIASEMNQ
jgi:hypothetical protein